MSIGEMLAGAGRVGAGMRQAQSEVRAARLEQLKMEQANRLQQFLNQAASDTGIGAPDAALIRPGADLLPTAPDEQPSAPATSPVTQTAQTTPSAGVRVSAAGPAGGVKTSPAPAIPATPAAPTATKPTAPAPKIDAETGLPLPTGALTAAETARLNQLRQLRVATMGVSGVTEPGRYASLAVNTPPVSESTRALIAQTENEYRQLLAKEAAYSKAAQQFTSLQEPILLAQQESRRTGISLSPTEAAAPVELPRAGVTTPEEKQAKQTRTAKPTQATAEVSTTAESSVVFSPEARKAAIAEDPELKQVFDVADLYMANPNAVPYQMQQALSQRAELARLGNLMLASRTPEGFQSFLQIKAQVNALDNSMIELQGMQGIAELTYYRDPRRLAGIISLVTGGSMAIQPRTDGKYNLVPLVNGQPAEKPVATGLDTNELAVAALKMFSPSYRQRAMDVADKRSQQAYETQLDAEIKRIEAQGKISAAQATALGKIKSALLSGDARVRAAAIAAAGNANLKLSTDSNGNVFLVHGSGVSMLVPGTEGTADTPATGAAFTTIPYGQ